MLLKVAMAALVLVVSSAAQARMPLVLLDQAPKFIKDGGAQILEATPAPGGLVAYTAVKDGKPIVFYSTADGTVSLVGVLFDTTTGQNLSDAFVERSQTLVDKNIKHAPARVETKPATASPAAGSAAIAKRIFSNEVAGVMEGNGTPASTTYVFFDPRCPYCHSLFRNTRAVAEMGAKIKWIPVNTLGEPGIPLSAEVLRTGLPALEALSNGRLRDGGKASVMERERIEVNTSLFRAVVKQVGKDAATPTILFQGKNGKFTVVQDDGSDKAAFAAAFPVGKK